MPFMSIIFLVFSIVCYCIALFYKCVHKEQMYQRLRILLVKLWVNVCLELNVNFVNLYCLPVWEKKHYINLLVYKHKLTYHTLLPTLTLGPIIWFINRGEHFVNFGTVDSAWQSKWFDSFLLFVLRKY